MTAGYHFFKFSIIFSFAFCSCAFVLFPCCHSKRASDFHLLFDIFATALSAVQCLTLLKQSVKVTSGQRAEVTVHPEASKHQILATVLPLLFHEYLNFPAGSVT
jgi:hypothetical protein